MTNSCLVHPRVLVPEPLNRLWSYLFIVICFDICPYNLKITLDEAQVKGSHDVKKKFWEKFITPYHLH